MEVTLPCNQCTNGKVVEHSTAIAKSALKEHMAKHAYTRRPDGNANDIIGADCDCPRVSVKHTHPCVRCGGTGAMRIEAHVPELGDRVIVRDAKLLEDMGIPEFIGKVGTVLTIDDPRIDEADLVPAKDLRVTANVTWAETNKKGKVLAREIKANNGIETFGFTPLELRWA